MKPKLSILLLLFLISLLDFHKDLEIKRKIKALKLLLFQKIKFIFCTSRKVLAYL